MKIKDIIIRYLEVRGDKAINIPLANHIIQTKVPEFALNIYGRIVSPATCDRVWRLLRNDPVYLRIKGLVVNNYYKSGSKEKHFIVRKSIEIHRNSTKQSSEQREDNPSNRSAEVPAVH